MSLNLQDLDSSNCLGLFVHLCKWALFVKYSEPQFKHLSILTPSLLLNSFWGCGGKGMTGAVGTAQTGSYSLVGWGVGTGAYIGSGAGGGGKGL